MWTSVTSTLLAVAGALGSDDLEQKHPGIRDRICDENGKVRRFVNLYVNEDDIRFLQQLDTKVADGDELSIVPAIAGGLR